MSAPVSAPKAPTHGAPATTRDREPDGPFDAELLYEALRDDKLSMRDIAALFGVTRQTIHRWRTSPRFKLYAAQMADAIFERAEAKLSDLYARALDTIAAGMEAERAIVVGDENIVSVPDHGTRTNSARVAIEEARRARASRPIMDDSAGKAVPRDRTDLIERVRKAANAIAPQQPGAN